MNKIFKVFGIVAFAAIIVFSMTAASCFGGGGTSEGRSTGRGDHPLVGKWFESQENADRAAADIAAGIGFTNKEIFDIGPRNLPDGWTNASSQYEFTSNGRLIVGGLLEVTYTATANTVTANIEGGLATADFTISGNVLTLTQSPNARGGGFVSGTYYRASR
jgi:hypothetical protein